MNKTTILLTNILACVLLAAPAPAQFTPQATAIPGSAPEGFNYQGRLEDAGFPVNATKSMVFRVYSAAAAGTLLWTSPAQSVNVSLGLFNAVVPVPVTTLVGGGARYLEVQIDGTLMSPRELLNSVPYALIAKSVEGTIDVSTAGLAINANSTAPQPALYISSVTGNVGVGTSAPVTAFDVGGSAQFGSGATKSTFTASGALDMAGKITAPDYTATYGLSAATGAFSGNLSVGGSITGGTGAGGSLVFMNGAAGQPRALLGQTAAINRWIMYLGNPTAESGSDAGSNFQLFAISDAGAGIDSPVLINRAAGGDILLGQTGGRKVGIGTASPGATLHVVGNGAFSSGVTASSLTVNGVVGVSTGTQPTSYANAMNIVHTANATEDGSGGVGLGIYSSFSNATVGRGGILGLGGVTSGMVGPAWNFATVYGFRENATPTNTAGYFGIATNPNGGLAIERMRITSTGNVGIGTVTPATKLHMSSGILTVDGTGANIHVTNHANFDDANDSTSLGEGAGIVNTGVDNTFLGQAAGMANVSGTQNTFLGRAAGFTNIAGTKNTFVGNVAGYFVTDGDNTIIGSRAMNIASAADSNVAIGEAVAFALTTGDENVIIGEQAGYTANPANATTTGSGNTFVGYQSGQSGTTQLAGSSAFGYKSLVGCSDCNAYGIGSTKHGFGTDLPATKLHMSSGTLTIDGNAATSIATIGNVGVGTGGATPADRLEVAGGNVRLTAVAGSAGSVKLFSTLTVGAVTCAVQCGANTACLAAWDSAGTVSTCATSAASNRCLCSGFGD